VTALGAERIPRSRVEWANAVVDISGLEVSLMGSTRWSLRRGHAFRWLAFVTSLLIVLAWAQWPATAAERTDADADDVDEPALHGQWSLDRSRDSDRVHLGFRQQSRHGNSNWGRTLPAAQFEGLAAGALERDDEAVEFRLVRDAGTFHCRGSIAKGRGAGTFELSLDPDFARELERRGIGRPTEAEQARMAFADAGFDLLDALREEKYPTPKVAMLVRMADHGVNAEYVRGMAEADFRLGSLETLTEARDHGVTPSFVRGLGELGFRDLSYEQVKNARDHGVTPEYIRGMQKAGAEAESMEQWIELRDHGVNADYVNGMRKAGYASASVEDLRLARDHGVDADYVEMLADAGFARLPLEKVVRARDHGLSSGRVRQARDRLGPDATIDEVIEWHSRGGR
jgi:hypothetical protein